MVIFHSLGSSGVFQVGPKHPGLPLVPAIHVAAATWSSAPAEVQSGPWATRRMGEDGWEDGWELPKECWGARKKPDGTGYGYLMTVMIR